MVVPFCMRTSAQREALGHTPLLQALVQRGRTYLLVTSWTLAAAVLAPLERLASVVQAPCVALGTMASSTDLAALNTKLADQSYVSGAGPTQDDFALWKTMPKCPTNPHVARWWKHIEALQKQFPLRSWPKAEAPKTDGPKAPKDAANLDGLLVNAVHGKAEPPGRSLAGCPRPMKRSELSQTGGLAQVLDLLVPALGSSMGQLRSVSRDRGARG